MAMLHSLIARRRFGPQTQWRSLRKTLVGWGLTICLWLGPPWFNYWFSFTLAYNRISHEYSSLFIIMITLIFMFSLWCIDWVGSLYANQILCVSVLRVASGPRVKLASCKSALNPPVVCSTDRSKAVVPVLVLLFVALWFILRGDLLYVFPCVILFLCFSVLLVLRLPRLGKRELILVLFVRLFGLCLFGFVGFLFLLVSGKGYGLWLWHSLDFSLTFFILQKSGKYEDSNPVGSRIQLIIVWHLIAQSHSLSFFRRLDMTKIMLKRTQITKPSSSNMK